MLEVAIDYFNHLGRLNVVGWGILNVGGDVIMFVVTCCLVHAWAFIVKNELSESRLWRLAVVLRYGLYVVAPVVLLYLLFQLIHWGDPSFTGVLVPVFMALTIFASLVVVISFFILGGRLLYLITHTISKGQGALTFKVTLVTMTCALSLTAFMVIMAIRVAVVEGVLFISASQDLANITIVDILVVLVGYGIIVAFGLHSFKELRSAGHTSGPGTSPSANPLRQPSAKDLYRRDPESGRPASVDMGRADDIVMDLKPAADES